MQEHYQIKDNEKMVGIEENLIFGVLDDIGCTTKNDEQGQQNDCSCEEGCTSPAPSRECNGN